MRYFLASSHDGSRHSEEGDFTNLAQARDIAFGLSLETGSIIEIRESQEEYCNPIVEYVYAGVGTI